MKVRNMLLHETTVSTNFIRVNNELLAIASIDKMLNRLNFNTRLRVLRWAVDKHLKTGMHGAVIQFNKLQEL